MFNEEFTKKINSVFMLMYENKIGRDIDDTLLEKLLSFIKSAGIVTEGKESKKDFLEKLVQETDALHLIEKALDSAGGKTKDLCTAIEVFCIKMFGVILEVEELFVSYKKSLLLESVFVICMYTDISTLSTSILDALLVFSLCIAKHDEGMKWSLERSIPDFVFASFQSSSYYVRKSAASYFAVILPLWSSKAVSMSDPENSLMNDFLQKILPEIVSSIEFVPQPPKSNISDCCIMTLDKLLTAKDKQLSENFSEVLLQGMKSLLDNAAQTTYFHSKIINLLIKLLTLKPETEPVLIDIVKSLLKQLNFDSAYHLAAEILRVSERCHPITKNKLNFILLPFHILTDDVPGDTSDDVFHILPEMELVEMKKIMRDTKTCVEIVCNILQSLSSMTCLMDLEALQTVVSCLNIDKCEQNMEEPNYHTVILQQRLVQLTIISLFKSIATEKVYMILNHDLIMKLYKHLLFFLEKLFTFDHYICDTLKLLKTMTALTSKNNFDLPAELKEKLTQLLCKKLLGTRESIVETAISLAAEIVNADYCDWQEIMFRYDIPSIVWDLAVEGSCDGTVKATAINAITEICMQPMYWKEISSVKGISEVDMENILLLFCSAQDFLVQREAFNCLFKWVKAKWNTGPSDSRTKLFVVLTSTMKSLDLDLKIASLRAWLWLNENYFPKLSDAADIEEYLKFLSDCGFGSSVLLAIKDSDEPVQCMAADTLVKLKNKLSSLGVTKNYQPLDNPTETRNSTETATCDVNIVSKEEKTAGIDSVLSLTTAQQIGNITKITDVKKPYAYKDYNFDLTKSKGVACTVSALWTEIWSESIDSIVQSNKETDNNNNITYAISLLDDIIDSKELLSESEDTPDCY